MLTAALASKLLRQILTDYNQWPSDGDSPLTVRRSKTPVTEESILSRDASARRASELGSFTGTYKPPARTVKKLNLKEVFQPLILRSVELTSEFAVEVSGGILSLESLQLPIEKSEFFVQIYSLFNQLAESCVFQVTAEPTPEIDNPYIGLYITGKSADGENIIAQTLVQNDSGE